VNAQLRLACVRRFLERLDKRFPEGIPLEYSAAIREELAPLVLDAQLELLEQELGAEFDRDLLDLAFVRMH
jgi:hypothetical protein